MEHKQVIVMRKDLNMRKGKMVAQGAHASMKAILDLTLHVGGVYLDGAPGSRDAAASYGALYLPLDNRIAPWLQGRFTKICVYVNSEQELVDLYERAKDAGLICSMIEDAGLTEFNGVVTKTCVAVGPDDEAKVNQITGHLPLL